MYNRLENIIKKLEGNVLTIGLDDKLLIFFDKNKKVDLYLINKKNKNSILTNNKKRMTNKGKSINIKKLRKYINKNSVNYLICNMEEIMSYYKYFIRDSIFISNNIIYIYAKNNIEKEFIINKYKRYNVEISCTDYKDGYILTIDNKKGKNNKIKDIFYFIKDTLYNIAEFIGNILIS